MFIPGFSDEALMRANLKNLRDIYGKETNSVMKTAPKRSHKVLYSNSVEEQNVKYASNLLNKLNCFRNVCR